MECLEIYVCVFGLLHESLVFSAENEVSVWDKHVQAQSAKKAQVIHVNSRSNENSGSRPSTNRASRNSALAPSMALLRARNAM